MDMFYLTKRFWDWASENPTEVKPNMVAVYFCAVDLCNRLNWPKEFQFPTDNTMAKVGISSRNTYSKTFKDLVENNLIVLVQKAKNQNTACFITFPRGEKRTVKQQSARAIIEQADEQASERRRYGTDTIIKPNKTLKTFKENINNKDFLKIELFKNEELISHWNPTHQEIDEFLSGNIRTQKNLNWKDQSAFYNHFQNWMNSRSKATTHAALNPNSNLAKARRR